MMGAIIIFTRLIKPSPRGFRLFPKPGFRYPTTIPRKTAIRTCTYKIRYHGFRRVASCLGGFVIRELGFHGLGRIEFRSVTNRHYDMGVSSLDRPKSRAVGIFLFFHLTPMSSSLRSGGART